MSKLRTPRIVWAALLLGQAQFIGIAAAGFLGHGIVEPDPWVPVLAGAAGLLFAILSLVVPSLLARSTAAREAEPLRAAGGAKDRDALVAVAVRAGFTPFIVSLAMSEFVSLQGVLVAALGHPFSVSAPFFGLGLVLVAVRFPTEASFVGPLERALR